MKKTGRIFGLLLILLFAGSTMVNAQYGRGRASNDPYGYCMNLPDITEKQKSELTALSGKHRTEMDALRNEMRSSMDLDERNELRLKMTNLRNSHISDIQSILTDSQKQAFNSACPAYRSRIGRGQGFGAARAGRAGRVGRGVGRGYRM